MFSFAHAYAYLLFAEARPASAAAVDPLDSLLTRLVSAPIESLALWRRSKPADDGPAVSANTPPLRALDGGRSRPSTRSAACDETLRPAA